MGPPPGMAPSATVIVKKNIATLVTRQLWNEYDHNVRNKIKQQIGRENSSLKF